MPLIFKTNKTFGILNLIEIHGILLNKQNGNLMMNKIN